jgi:hypothetical protein
VAVPRLAALPVPRLAPVSVYPGLSQDDSKAYCPGGLASGTDCTQPGARAVTRLTAQAVSTLAALALPKLTAFVLPTLASGNPASIQAGSPGLTLAGGPGWRP